MARAEISTTINRPVEEVFAVLSNLENNPKWSSAALEAKTISAGPIGVGTRARFVGKFLGRRIESESEITEFEPNRKLAFQNMSGPFPFRGSLTVEAIEGETRVNADFEAEPGGFFKLAEPLFMSMGRRQFENDLANLKKLMEAHAL
ncbi:MAG: SRPBCC family protein [Candidatus Limnocylindria bacterium]